MEKNKIDWKNVRFFVLWFVGVMLGFIGLILITNQIWGI